MNTKVRLTHRLSLLGVLALNVLCMGAVHAQSAPPQTRICSLNWTDPCTGIHPTGPDPGALYPQVGPLAQVCSASPSPPGGGWASCPHFQWDSTADYTKINGSQNGEIQCQNSSGNHGPLVQFSISFSCNAGVGYFVKAAAEPEPSSCPANATGDPIDPVSGAVIRTEGDCKSIPGVKLAFGRFYNSTDHVRNCSLNWTDPCTGIHPTGSDPSTLYAQVGPLAQACSASNGHGGGGWASCPHFQWDSTADYTQINGSQNGEIQCQNSSGNHGPVVQFSISFSCDMGYSGKTDLSAGWRHSYGRHIIIQYSTIATQTYLQSANTSSQYADPATACTSGFAEIQAKVSQWSGALAAYSNGNCVLNKNGAYIGSIEVYSIGGALVPAPKPIAYDVMRDDGQMTRFIVDGTETIIAPPGNAMQLQQTSSGYTLTDANDTVEKYDTNGKLLTITSRAGVVQTMSYDTSGRLSGVSDSFGHQLTLGYDSQGRISSVTRQ